MFEKWMTPREVARHLGLAGSAEVYMLIDQGQLTGYRFARQVRIRTQDLHAYINGWDR